MLPVLLGLGLLIGGAIIVANWGEVVDWLKDFVPRMKKFWEEFKKNIPHGARIYGDLIVEGADRLAKVMHKLYYKEDGHWVEQTTTRKIPEDEVPEAIRSKLNRSNESDITETMEEELDLEV